MTKAFFIALFLFSVNSHAEAEKLLAACAGVQIEHGSKEVDVVHVKVIQEYGSTEPDLVVFKNQKEVLKLSVEVETTTQMTEYNTGKFTTDQGLPSYLKLTVKTENFQSSGTLMEISFGPQIGTTALSCAVL